MRYYIRLRMPIYQNIGEGSEKWCVCVCARAQIHTSPNQSEKYNQLNRTIMKNLNRLFTNEDTQTANKI